MLASRGIGKGRNAQTRSASIVVIVLLEQAAFSLFCGKRVTDASSGFRAIKLSLFDDRRINLWQDWLDRYELEPYLLFTALRLRHKVIEAPVTIEYPKTDGIAYTKMRAITDWWKIFRPII